MLDCPPAAALAGFGTDMAETDALASLEEHIDGCSICQEKLEGLARADAMPAHRVAPLLPGMGEAPVIPGFVIERELGRGGMGVVYQAFEPSLGRRVALKVVPSGPSASAHDHEHWLREARSFARVRHDNVVRLYQVGEADGWLYIVLELVTGGSLEQRLEVPFTPRDAASLLEAVARAVIAIHREGLVHLDLKPSNILLDSGPETPRGRPVPRVGDFGIAFRSDEHEARPTTGSGFGPLGTPSYMAPEQVASDRGPLGPAADIYGLGAILYHLLTGHRPFAAANVVDTLDHVCNQEPVPPRRFNRTVPRDLETICLKCLEKEPGRRYPSAESLADDLRRWLDGLPIAARPISPAEMAWRSCRHRPAVAGLTLALLSTIFAGFLGMFLLWRCAEADFQIASEVLEQIVDLNTGGQGGLSRVVSPDRLIDILEQTRHRLRARRTQSGPRVDLETTLLRGEAAVRDAHGGSEVGQVQSLLEQSVADLEAILRRNPGDIRALIRLVPYLPMLSSVAEHLGKEGESIDHLRRAVRATEERARLDPGESATIMLAQNREALALSLAKRGDRDESRSLLLANRLMLERIPAESRGPEILAWQIHLHSDFARLIEAGSSAPPDRSRRDRAGGTDALTRLASPEADRLSAEAWAELAAAALDADDGSGSASRSNEAPQFYLCNLLASTASELRRLKKIDECRRIVDRLLAFARLMVDRYPDRPDAYLTLGEGYLQLNKIGWETHDRSMIETNLKRSIEMTQHALSLDPHHEIARFVLYQRQCRLRNLLDSRRDAETLASQTTPAGS